jgi:hypothetical protein
VCYISRMTVHSDHMANDQITDIEDIKLRGAKVPANESLCALYRRAFRDYGVRALWSSRRLPTFWRSPKACGWRAAFPDGGWLSRLWRHAVPLSSFQSRLLRLLASHRSPESCVAGAAPLARSRLRSSDDIDGFHDRELAMQEAVKADTERLRQNGFQIDWTRRFPTLVTAVIRSGDDGTLLTRVVDSAYRFFPALQDELFGYVLHPADIATNKALAGWGSPRTAPPRGGNAAGIWRHRASRCSRASVPACPSRACWASSAMV